MIERERLGATQREAMWALMDRHFLAVDRSVFERDLDGKDYAVLLTDGGGLRGFTTFALVATRFAGEDLSVVYSGDTIVDLGARGSFALAATWIDSIRRLRAAAGGRRMVWLLICSSPRTYRFLPLFFRDFHPRAGTIPSPRQKRLIELLARRRYAGAFDAASGIVRLPNPQPLRPELVPPGDGRDEHDRCFADCNPGYRQGDELVCFTELDDANLTLAGRRMLRAGERSRAAEHQAAEHRAAEAATGSLAENRVANRAENRQGVRR